MERYIYEKRFAISDYLCEEIIDKLEFAEKINYCNNKESRYNYYSININNYPKLIISINNELEESLILIRQITNETHYDGFILFNNYECVKFEKNKDHKSYSYDFKVLEDNVFSYYEVILFLNTIENGGEVEIMDKKIKSEKGKLLIFPSGWLFPYSHKMPESDDQYVITGKIFKKY